MFDNINNPEPYEIKIWLKEVQLTINQASNALGISKRQFSRFLSATGKRPDFRTIIGLPPLSKPLPIIHEPDLKKGSFIQSDFLIG